MTAKEFVKSKLNNPKAERHKTNGNQTYWLIRENAAYNYYAEGETESKAWANAKNKLLNKD